MAGCLAITPALVQIVDIPLQIDETQFEVYW